MVYELSMADQALLLFLSATIQLMKCENVDSLEARLAELAAVPGAPWRRATDGHGLVFSPPCVLAGVAPFHILFGIADNPSDFLFGIADNPSDSPRFFFQFSSKDDIVPEYYYYMPLIGGQWSVLAYLPSDDIISSSSFFTPFDCLATVKRWFPEEFAVFNMTVFSMFGNPENFEEQCKASGLFAHICRL